MYYLCIYQERQLKNKNYIKNSHELFFYYMLLHELYKIKYYINMYHANMDMFV